MRWLWLLALAACGDNADPRLSVVRYLFDDGTEVAAPQQFHDRARDEICSPVRWSDAATYCTPAYAGAAYTDPICQAPIARVVDTIPAYVATYFHLGSVTSVRRLHRVAGEVDAPAQFWLFDGTSCAGPFTPDAGTHFRAVAEELDASAFVRLRRITAAGDQRLAVVTWRTDDGVRAPAAIHDATLASDCVLPDHHDAGQVTCEPAEAPPATYFADAGCAEPVVAVQGEPPALASFAVGTCHAFAAPASEVIEAPLFAPTAAGCAPATPPGGTRQFALGDPVTLATLSRRRAPGARLQPVSLTAPGVALPDDLVFDTQLGADCHPEPLAGALRCVPPAPVAVTPYFTDAVCAATVDVALVDEEACAPRPRFARGSDGVHRIEARLTTPLFEVSTGDRCVPFQPAAPLVAHAVSGPLPAETFAAADVRY